jgi:hypothetical protein
MSPTKTRPFVKPRVCMPMFSSFARNAFRTGMYEAQNILASCEDVDLLELQPAWGFSFREKLQLRLMYHDFSRRVVSFNPGLQPVKLTRDYDIFLMVCPFWQDVWYANAVKGWRDRCRISICWIDELWAKSVGDLYRWLPILQHFDYIFVSIEGTETVLGQALGRTCHVLAGGVDAIRFSPFPERPQRVIDVYSIGRRLEGVHHQLLKSARRNGLFYIYDTIQNGNSSTPDYEEHRNLYANMAKRSRFFTVAPGKVDVPHHTYGQIAVGSRFFEGAAAGAILIGQAPDTEPFERLFGWPDAIIPINPDGSDAIDILTHLLSDPERMARISHRNVAEAHCRHDWIYRWMQIYATAGLDPTPDMLAREQHLKQLAEDARAEVNILSSQVTIADVV